MPRYYCDYCDTHLTHDSPVVRKQHNTGYKHKANVRNYYMQFEEAQTQTLIDSKIKEHMEAQARLGGAFPSAAPFPGGPPGALPGALPGAGSMPMQPGMPPAGLPPPGMPMEGFAIMPPWAEEGMAYPPSLRPPSGFPPLQPPPGAFPAPGSYPPAYQPGGPQGMPQSMFRGPPPQQLRPPAYPGMPQRPQ